MIRGEQFNISAGILLIILLAASCVPQKRLTYFQNKDTTLTKFPVDTTYFATIQPNDILTIFVASISEDASRFFNFSQTPDQLANGYVVDHFGNIQLPLVGNLHVSGMTTQVARDSVIHRLGKYLINPSVRLNIQNFRVTIIGEVMRPGVYPVPNEKITITEALGLAGDLTPYSLRERVMIIRETNGRKEFGMVDFTARDLFASPYYNLHANDIIYVEAAKRKQLFTDNYFKVFSWFLASLTAIYLISRISTSN